MSLNWQECFYTRNVSHHPQLFSQNMIQFQIVTVYYCCVIKFKKMNPHSLHASLFFLSKNEEKVKRILRLLQNGQNKTMIPTKVKNV